MSCEGGLNRATRPVDRFNSSRDEKATITKGLSPDTQPPANILARRCLTRVAADPPSRFLHGSSGGEARAGR